MYYVRTHAHTQTSTHTNTHENTRMCTHIPTHLLILQYFSDPNLGGFQEILDFCPINIVSNYTVTASARYYNSSRTLEIHISVDINCWYTYFYLITCRHLVTANDQETSVCCILTDLLIHDLEEYLSTLQHWCMFDVMLLVCRWQCVYGDFGSHFKMCGLWNPDQLGI